MNEQGEYSSDPHYRMIKSNIPSEVEETGILLFEPLSNTEDQVKFRFKFRVEGHRQIKFIF
jgi:hypothetical protein